MVHEQSHTYLQGPKKETTDMGMTGYKAEDQARDLSGLKHDATRNNLTTEAINIDL